MSGKTHNKDAKLKALLDQQAVQQQPGDDFEKEALEGFAMLDNQQEAFDLKADLDQQMQSQLFAEKKPASPARYWLAAAGLALVVGTSAYFVLSSEKNAEKEMAVTNAILNIDSAAAAPAAEQSYELKNARLDSARLSYNASSTDKDATPKYSFSAAQEEATGKAASEPQNISYKAKAPAPAEAQPQAPKGNADLALNETPSNEVLSLPIEKNAEGKLAEKDMEDKEVVTAPAKSEAKRQEAKKRSKNDVSTASGTITPGLVSTSYSWSQNSQMSDSVQNCYYEGGNAALQKVLTQRLKEKGLDRHFSATLFIAFNARVSKVEFTKATGISQEEQNEISYVIQSLDQFKFYNKPAKNEVAEYKISR